MIQRLRAATGLRRNASLTARHHRHEARRSKKLLLSPDTPYSPISDLVEYIWSFLYSRCRHAQLGLSAIVAGDENRSSRKRALTRRSPSESPLSSALVETWEFPVSRRQTQLGLYGVVLSLQARWYGTGNKRPYALEYGAQQGFAHTHHDTDKPLLPDPLTLLDQDSERDYAYGAPPRQ